MSEQDHKNKHMAEIGAKGGKREETPEGETWLPVIGWEGVETDRRLGEPDQSWHGR